MESATSHSMFIGTQEQINSEHNLDIVDAITMWNLCQLSSKKFK